MNNFNPIPAAELLPQQPPFLMVDLLTACDENADTTTLFTIAPDNIFISPDGSFAAPGIIENIAQTCAARMGYICKYIRKLPIRIGYIGAVRKLSVEKLPCAGDRLATTVTVVAEALNVTLVNAQVRCNGELIASGQMKIAMSNEE